MLPSVCLFLEKTDLYGVDFTEVLITASVKLCTGFLNFKQPDMFAASFKPNNTKE